jgi:uroporphyrinogen decarboxylase
MDSKELVNRALSFEKVSRVPYAIDFTVPAKQKLCSSARGIALLGRLSNDVVLTPAIRVEWGVRDPEGCYTDEFGLVWDRRVDPDIGIPQPLLTPENFDSFRWPDPRIPGRFDLLERNLNAHPDRFNMMSIDFSLHERAWGLRGLENVDLDIVDRPDFYEALLDKILDFNMKIIEIGLEKYPGIDGVHFGDDYGDQNGVSIGVERWRRMVKPRLARQYGLVKSAGKTVSVHCCGRVQAILDDFVEIGVDLFNPFQPEVMDVDALLHSYHGKLAFWGGISTQRLLPYGSSAEVQRDVAQLLSMGRNGGYVIAPAHAVPGDARESNLHAILELILGQ